LIIVWQALSPVLQQMQTPLAVISQVQWQHAKSHLQRVAPFQQQHTVQSPPASARQRFCIALQAT
jgi:hypothetical protein